MPVGKRLFGRPRRRRDDNIKMNFRKWDRGIDLIDLVQDMGR